jgi:ribonuclease T1
MRYVTLRTVKVLLALVLAVVGTAGLVTTSAAASVTPAVVRASCGDASRFDKAALSSLPSQATDTVKLIKTDGPFPYPKNDGVVFSNRERILPKCSASYYHEYTVITPGAGNRGARRIITGGAGEYFYTADHYRSFSLVNINA